MTNEDMEWFANNYKRNQDIKHHIDYVIEKIDSHLGNDYCDYKVLSWHINGQNIVVEYTNDGEYAEYNTKFPFAVFTTQYKDPLWAEMVNASWAVTKKELDEVDRQRKELQKKYRKADYDRLKKEFGD